MKLLSEINSAAVVVIETTTNLQRLMDITGLDIKPISEAVTQFLTNYATKIEKGEFQPKSAADDANWQKEKEQVISIFAAINALTDKATALAYEPDNTNPGVGADIDQGAMPIGSVLSNFYGKNGPEAHKIAKHRLIEIGRTVSPTLRARAEKAISDPTRIREYANKLQVDIEPVMNSLLAQENKTAEANLRGKHEKEKEANMAKPMQGMIPQRS